MRALRTRAACGAIALATAAVALAQDPVQRTVRVGEPLLLVIPNEPAPSQREAPTLTAPQLEALRRAQSEREGRLFDRARKTLADLAAQAPHHPWIVTEIGRLGIAEQNWGAVERLGREERQSQKDSVVLSHELAIALEKLKRPREAAQVVLETWTAAPTQVEWARSTLLHLASMDPRAVRDITQRFADRAPERVDFLVGLAQLHWQLGDRKTALHVLESADHATKGVAVRLNFADELLDHATAEDSSGAIEAILDVAGDGGAPEGMRIAQAARAWKLFGLRRAEAEGAPRIVAAMQGFAPSRWPGELLSGVVRGLRQAGRTNEARALLESRGGGTALPPELALERALADLRDGPPERALPALATTSGSPEGTFYYGEALFFAGMSDSALDIYKSVSQDPQGPFTGAALERIYLIEDARPKSALAAFGRIAYESWRGDSKKALALSDSLYHALPRGPLWAQAALELGTRREAAGDARGALEPLLALADSLPDDRLAPRARQRAGDVYLNRLKDDSKAAAQYEECLARYPRAWNAPEIRRKLEVLRRERRF